MPIIFSEASGLNDSIYGNCQAPIKMFIQERGEAHETNSILKHLFLMGTSDNFGDTFTSMTAMEGFMPVGENGAYPADGMQQGYEKLLKYVTWKDSFSISAEMIEDAKLMDLKQRPQAFMTSYERTREKFGAALYAGAIAGKKTITFGKHTFDVTSADGSPMFSVSHKPKVKGAVQSNLFADQFSVDALDYAESHMQNLCGDNEEILQVAPDTILIPNDAELKRKVFAAIGADKDPMTANNGFNYQFGRWRVIVWNYLNQFITSGSKPWLLLDSKYNETYGGAIWNDRLKLNVHSYIDNGTDANVWNGRSRFNACFNDFRFAACGGMEGGTQLLKA